MLRLLCLLPSLAFVAALPVLNSRKTTLADGTTDTCVSGQITSNWFWQSSGVLTHGGCPGDVGISDCYDMLLDDHGMLCDSDSDSTIATDVAFNVATASSEGEDLVERASGASEDGALLGRRRDLLKREADRQRIEILTLPGAGAGTKWQYRWKSWFGSETGTTSEWFTFWQIIRRDGPGDFVVRLDGTDGNLQIQDSVRGCMPCGHQGNVSVSTARDRTIVHDLSITYGSDGAFAYSGTFQDTGELFLSYSVTSGEMGSDGSLKFGMYRGASVDINSARAAVGDFAIKQL